MKITHITNACCVYESEGFRFLTDPWLNDGAFEGSWYHYPPLEMTIEHVLPIDLLYLSHLHPDHFEEETLRKIPRDVTVVFLDHEPNYLKRKLEGLGFTNLVGLKDHEKRAFGPFLVTMLAPFVGNLFHDSVIGNILDSSLVIEADDFQVLNGNDNPPTLEAAEKLYESFGAFDLVQLVDSCAGPYPACFTNLTAEEKISERDRILTRHLELMIECAKILKARYFQPFAGHYQLGGKLQKLNPYLAVYEPLAVAVQVQQAGIPALYLKEGDSFDSKTGATTIRRTCRTDRVKWEQKVKRIPYDYERFPFLSHDELSVLKEKALERLRRKQKEWNCYPSWIVIINGSGFSLAGEHESGENHIWFEMDERLLGAILKREAHWNNAEVGCHMEIHREPNVYDPDIHLLLCSLHV
jgi:UDP-MurNAc hydroxylase